MHKPSKPLLASSASAYCSTMICAVILCMTVSLEGSSAPEKNAPMNDPFLKSLQKQGREGSNDSKDDAIEEKSPKSPELLEKDPSRSLVPSGSSQEDSRNFSGVGGRAYIEAVNGVVTVAMSHQEATMGVIAEVCVSKGQKVKRGDVLAVSSQYSIRKKQLSIVRSELGLAQTDFKISENKAVSAKKKLDRNEKMLTSKTVSHQEFESIQKDSIEADLLVQKHKILVKMAQEKVDLYEKMLEQCQVFAPMDGVILVIHGKVGEQFRANEGLLIMADIDQLEIVAEVHENDISNIFLDQKAEISFQNKMSPIMGRVSYISGIVRSNTLQDADPKKDHDLRVIEVRLSISNEDSQKIRNFLRMHADVRFFAPDEEQKSHAITSVNQARAI